MTLVHPGNAADTGDTADYDRMMDDQFDADHDLSDDPYHAFWQARPILTHIRDYARAQRVSPWSVLAVVCIRASCATRPDVRLPALIGGPASLNLFAAIVGESGSGKGASDAAAMDAVEFVDQWGHPVTTEVLPIGSGEGIARTFRPADDPEDAPEVSAAIFSVPEVDTLAALGGRSGATIMPVLRQVYSGETIGFANSGKDTRLVVDRHTYRAGLIVGVQPLKAGALLDDADGGTPQRFGWFPVIDPYAPATRPDRPEPIKVELAAFGAQHEMQVPEVARETIDAHRLATLRGEDVDPLEGHALLCRLKFAAALAVMDGRAHVNADDWELSDSMMEVSRAARAMCADRIAEKSRAANRARAHADAERAELIADRQDGRLDRRARDAILRYLDRNGPSPRKPLRGSLRSDLRGRFDAVLSELIETGQVTQSGEVYRT